MLVLKPTSLTLWIRFLNYTTLASFLNVMMMKTWRDFVMYSYLSLVQPLALQNKLCWTWKPQMEVVDESLSLLMIV
jgi:uncharacterized protein with ParB-like and HNH nuclease domain